MFNFLKKAFGKFTKKVEEQAEPVKPSVAQKETKIEQIPFTAKREVKQKIISETKIDQLIPEIKTKPIINDLSDFNKQPISEQKKSFFKKKIQAEKVFAKQETVEQPKELKKIQEKKSWLSGLTKAITETKLSDVLFDKLFSTLETELLQSNVALEVAERIKSDLRLELVGKSLKRMQVSDMIKKILKETIIDILDYPKQIDLLAMSDTQKPLIILFVGVNGVGKTTNMAKLAHMFQKQDKSVVFAAADTFRAASIEQLEFHANKLGIHLIKHQYGADPAAVAFDAVKHARAKAIDVVMIDTAGRQQANEDLMNELAKIKRVVVPTVTILVVDALTGNDAVEQAKTFDEKIGVDGVIMSKTDADEKGGALISVVFSIKKPILYVGMGQTYNDIKIFKTEDFIDAIV